MIKVKNDYSNTSLIVDVNKNGASLGPVVHYRSSPNVGKTSLADITNINIKYLKKKINLITVLIKLSFLIAIKSKKFLRILLIIFLLL